VFAECNLVEFMSILKVRVWMSAGTAKEGVGWGSVHPPIIENFQLCFSNNSRFFLRFTIFCQILLQTLPLCPSLRPNSRPFARALGVRAMHFSIIVHMKRGVVRASLKFSRGSTISPEQLNVLLSLQERTRYNRCLRKKRSGFLDCFFLQYGNHFHFLKYT
jgi:hypothetical protein